MTKHFKTLPLGPIVFAILTGKILVSTYPDWPVAIVLSALALNAAFHEWVTKDAHTKEFSLLKHQIEALEALLAKLTSDHDVVMKQAEQVQKLISQSNLQAAFPAFTRK